jgi:uncharacterized protein YbjT (DUF2867 family)
VDVLVTGGSGHLGSEVVRLLLERGENVRVLSRTQRTNPEVMNIRGDLGTGQGVREAVSGAHTIVHAATMSPAAQRGNFLPIDFVRSPGDVDVEGTRRLLHEAKSAGAEHFLLISIVGVQESRIPYLRRKAQAENLVRSSPLPWTILAATPFYWLLERLHDHMAKKHHAGKKRPWPVASNLIMQPGDSAEFASYVVETVAAGPGQDLPCFAGPEVLTHGEIARQYQAARNIECRTVEFPLPAMAVRAGGPQTCPQGRLGSTTWAEWLIRH